MANVLVQDGAGVAKYLKATGDGSNGDPFVSAHTPVDAVGTEIFYKGTTVLSGAVSVATTATALPASALAARRVLWIYNNGAATIFLGPAGVTTSNGFPLLPGQSVSLAVGALVMYGIVATGTVAARVMEVA